jgi:2-keto-4-pentenoate hydratase/2-oxohepta-3-ene-1,7-dioic acid hydratase in catechol pathway
MKLLLYGPKKHERPASLDQEGKICDLSGEVTDSSGQSLRPDELNRIGTLDSDRLLVVTGNPRIAACAGRVGKFICIGLNHSDLAAETGMAVPKKPVIFNTFPMERN